MQKKVHIISPVQQGVKPIKGRYNNHKKAKAQQIQNEGEQENEAIGGGHECKFQIRYAKKIMIRKKKFSPYYPVLNFSEENKTLP